MYQKVMKKGRKNTWKIIKSVEKELIFVNQCVVPGKLKSNKNCKWLANIAA